LQRNGRESLSAATLSDAPISPQFHQVNLRPLPILEEFVAGVGKVVGAGVEDGDGVFYGARALRTPAEELRCGLHGSNLLGDCERDPMAEGDAVLLGEPSCLFLERGGEMD